MDGGEDVHTKIIIEWREVDLKLNETMRKCMENVVNLEKLKKFSIILWPEMWLLGQLSSQHVLKLNMIRMHGML